MGALQYKLDFRDGSEADVKASVASVCFAPKSRLGTDRGTQASGHCLARNRRFR